MTENEIGTIVIELAIAVHQELGPGLLETFLSVSAPLREKSISFMPNTYLNKANIMDTDKSTAKGRRGADFPLEFRIANKIATPISHFCKKSAPPDP